MHYGEEGNAFLPVYRVNWLHAKARKERWQEEMELVVSEMSWTVNCFKYHEGGWEKRAKEAKGLGETAYAWKQKSMWEKWVKSAKDAFGTFQDI